MCLASGGRIFPANRSPAHNEPVNGGQATDVCPQCGSSAGVHSVQELADLARMRLGQQAGPAGASGPSGPGRPAQGGWEAEPQTGPVPGPGGVPPGWAAQPQTGPLPGPGQGRGLGQGQGQPRRPGLSSLGDGLSLGDSLGDDLASAALGAAAGLVGRSIARRMRGRVEQAMSAVTDRQQDMLRQQIAIAERHPDLRACLNDQVVFLAGGQRVLPMAGLTTSLTVEQSDAIVARLRA